ncbi:hypothetical protein E3N88_22421 [Mikania micrantha]|uniref:Uncharacterized protein n=1 Tax=Mikania micrantha TaxID=192012 RepID=A0A5N6NC66_9ASTR|nr:hypothetical protein E3N88_22421 [Mikania micrantha]
MDCQQGAHEPYKYPSYADHSTHTNKTLTLCLTSLDQDSSIPLELSATQQQLSTGIIHPGGTGATANSQEGRTRSASSQPLPSKSLNSPYNLACFLQSIPMPPPPVMPATRDYPRGRGRTRATARKTTGLPSRRHLLPGEGTSNAAQPHGLPDAMRYQL